jgi:hypothetical protein
MKGVKFKLAVTVASVAVGLGMPVHPASATAREGFSTCTTMQKSNPEMGEPGSEQRWAYCCSLYGGTWVVRKYPDGSTVGSCEHLEDEGQTVSAGSRWSSTSTSAQYQTVQPSPTPTPTYSRASKGTYASR